jgi:hypothetical protein
MAFVILVHRNDNIKLKKIYITKLSDVILV